MDLPIRNNKTRFFFLFLLFMFINFFHFKPNLAHCELCNPLLLLLIDSVMVLIFKIIDTIYENNRRMQKCFHWKWFHVETKYWNVMKRPKLLKSIEKQCTNNTKKKYMVHWWFFILLLLLFVFFCRSHKLKSKIMVKTRNNYWTSNLMRSLRNSIECDWNTEPMLSVNWNTGRS